MSPPDLSPAVAAAEVASGRALRALSGLAEALGTPGTVPAALAEAEAALAEAEAALAGLEAALVAGPAALGPAGTAGLDAPGLYRALEAAAAAGAAELERELDRNRRYRRRLRLGQGVAAGLLLLGAPLLSLDAVREALGVTQESHLVPALATLVLGFQVALWGAGTSRRHLATAACHQRHQALGYHRLARDAAAAAAATARATEATAAASATLGGLEEVTCHLRALVAAVTLDLEVAKGFPASARALGDAVVALGTMMGDKEGTQRLAQALEALRGDE